MAKTCLHCGKVIPDWKRSHALYCGGNCRHKAFLIRHGIKSVTEPVISVNVSEKGGEQNQTPINA
jgi:hypothetical protein